MKSKLLVVLSLLVLASCKQPAQTIVVAGDSWASYVCYYKSLDKALNKAGVLDAATNSACASTTLIGVRADEWMDSGFHKATLAALLDKSVKVLYLSLGGNDILNYWNKNMDATQEKEVFDQVAASVEAVIKEYQKARPDIKIILSGYDFPRFTADHPIQHYREAFEDMGRPTPFELNSGVLRFSERISQLADQKKVFYIQHYGLMHYYLGNADKGLAPLQTLSPDLISAPDDVNQFGGDVNLQTDPAGMFTIEGGEMVIVDAFHLNRFGYDKLAEHTVFHYLKSWLGK